MHYNPPPNWPKPPKGWAPYPDWSPDPSWPPPPPGWQLWVDDEPSNGSEERSAPAELGRLKHAGDDGEYFGDENAWADDAGPAPSDDDLDGLQAESEPQTAEVAPEELSARHLGRTATVKWGDERVYNIGRIVAVTADATTISVKLAGVEAPVTFLREPSPDGPENPRILI